MRCCPRALPESAERRVSDFSSPKFQQHGMGICSGGPVRHVAVWGLCQDQQSGLRARDFTKAAWAFCDGEPVGCVAVQGALPESAERCVGDFSSQDLTNTAWAFAVAGQSEAWLFRGSARISRAVCG